MITWLRSIYYSLFRFENKSNMKRSQPRDSRAECLNCGSILSSFNNTYKIAHEKTMHDGKYVNVKTITTPANPFSACTPNQGRTVRGGTNWESW